MARFYLILSILVTLALSSQAQLLRVHSAKSVDYFQGFNPKGFESALGYGYSFSNSLRMKTGFSYAKHTMPYSTFNRFQPYFSLYYNIYRFNEVIFLDAFGSAKIGLQNGSSEVFGKHSNFYFGQSIGLNAEYIVFHFLSAGLFASQDFYQLNDVNSKSFSFGLFVSYNF